MWDVPNFPCVKRFRNETERRGFEQFRSRSAWELGSGLHWRSWGEVILQNSEHSPAVRHAVIALGAIHGHRLQICDSCGRADKQELLKFAYCQYNEAIRQLRAELRVQSEASLVWVMLACMLFVIFDFVHGDDLAAATHLRSGLAILRNFVAGTALLDSPDMVRERIPRLGNDPAGRDQVSVKYSAEALQRNFTMAFAYLDFWSTIWIDSKPLLPEVTVTEDLTIEPTIDDKDELSFTLRCFAPLEYEIHVFLRAAKSTGNNRNSGSVPISFLNAKSNLVDQLLNWYRKLLGICACEYDRSNHERKAQIDRLALNHKKIQTMLLACQEDGTSDYRAFDSAFQEIVLLSAAMIEEKESLVIFPSHSFSFPYGVIQPLYITAISCCNIKICEQAIELLTSSRWTEGAWDSLVMAKIARRKLDGRIQMS